MSVFVKLNINIFLPFTMTKCFFYIYANIGVLLLQFHSEASFKNDKKNITEGGEKNQPLSKI